MMRKFASLTMTFAVLVSAFFASAQRGSAQDLDLFSFAPQRGSFKVQPRGFNPFDVSASRLTLNTFGRLSPSSPSGPSATTSGSSLASTSGGEPTIEEIGSSDGSFLSVIAIAASRPDYRPPVRSPYRPPPR
jgi:hypothetical protein